MQEESEQTAPQKNNRRKALRNIGILSLVPLIKFSFLSNFFSNNKDNREEVKPEQQAETMRFLTQEGKLVEVDISRLKSSGKKISDSELRAWIKK